MGQYEELLEHVYKNGEIKDDRTGVGTKSIFGHQMRFDLTKGFPLLTTKKIHFKSIVYELLWFLKGSTNIKFLTDNGVNIWNKWADEHGELGPVYGSQWRNWPSPSGSHIDQISNVINTLKSSPNSRRMIVSAWNVSEIENMKLPPCHVLFQFYVSNGRLSCQMYQRSADLFLGVPFNIASYALLTEMVAQVCGLEAYEFIHTFGDTHIYLNHFNQVEEQLSRDSRPFPILKLDKNIDDIFAFNYDDISIEGYNPHPLIKAPIAV